MPEILVNRNFRFAGNMDGTEVHIVTKEEAAKWVLVGRLVTLCKVSFHPTWCATANMESRSCSQCRSYVQTVTT